MNKYPQNFYSRKFFPGNGVIFIDFENNFLSRSSVTYSLEERIRIIIRVVALLKRKMKENYNVNIAHVILYGNVEFANLFHAAGISIIPAFATKNKNSADMQLCIAACKYLYTQNTINTFIILSGDRDYIPLIYAIKEAGKQYLIVGCKKSMSEDLKTIASDDYYEYIEDYINEPEPQQKIIHRKGPNRPPIIINRTEKSISIDLSGSTSKQPLIHREKKHISMPKPQEVIENDEERHNNVVEFIVKLILQQNNKCMNYKLFRLFFDQRYSLYSDIFRENTITELIGRVIHIKNGIVSLVPVDKSLEELATIMKKCFKEGEEWVKGSQIGQRYSILTGQKLTFVRNLLLENGIIEGRNNNGDYEIRGTWRSP